MIRTLVRPRSIPSDLPPTAPMRPPDYSSVNSVLPRGDQLEAAFAQWYTLAEKEFTHLRGPGASEGDAYCGRARPASFKWEPADKCAAAGLAGTTRLSRAWSAFSSWSLALGRPAPAKDSASGARCKAASVALGSLSAALNTRLDGDRAALDFQAFVTQLTWPVISTPYCMIHA